MKRLPLSLWPGTSEARAGRATLFGIALVALGACVPARPVPAFSAYWYASSEAQTCPREQHCIAYTESFEKFEKLRWWQRRHGLELVDFDARVTDDYEIYAGAWQKTELRHELVIGMSWGELISQNKQHSGAGERLVSFSFYEDRGARRVAAIWSANNKQSSSQQVGSLKQPLRPILSWNRLKNAPGNGDADKTYLDQIEVYEHPDRGSGNTSGAANSPQIAGLWRTGKIETKVLNGLACKEQQEIGANIPRCWPEAQLSIRYSRCELLTELYALHADGFRAVDFESYTEGGVERWAVLLHRRSEPDWLLFPGCLENIIDRDDELKTRRHSPPYVLFDLDIVSVVQNDRPPEYHEGVAHDGSTSGPPPSL